MKDKQELFKLMDELMDKGVGINLSAQIALAMVEEKARPSPEIVPNYGKLEEHIACHLKNGTHIPEEDIEAAVRMIMISVRQEVTFGQKQEVKREFTIWCTCGDAMKMGEYSVEQAGTEFNCLGCDFRVWVDVGSAPSNLPTVEVATADDNHTKRIRND